MFHKPNTSCVVKFLKPGIAPNAFNIVDKRVPGLQQRVFVSLGVATVPSMLKESIEVKILFSAKVTRADVKAVKPFSIE